MFSRLSVALQRTGCLTYKDLLGILRRCYTQSQGETTQEGARPQYARTSTVYAIREWLLPHMKAVHNLHDFHVFSIVRNENGEAEMSCKPWSMSQYDVESHPPLTLLKSKPTGVPELVKPNYGAIDLARLKGMVKKCVDVGVFKDEEEREWSEFLENEERLVASFDDVQERTYLDKSQGKFRLSYLLRSHKCHTHRICDGGTHFAKIFSNFFATNFITTRPLRILHLVFMHHTCLVRYQKRL